MAELDDKDGFNIENRTERGFAGFAKFKTHWHGDLRIQESSAAFHGPVVWVFTELSYSNTPKENAPTLHLKLKDAINLRDGLTKFIDAAQDGELTESVSDDCDEDDNERR